MKNFNVSLFHIFPLNTAYFFRDQPTSVLQEGLVYQDFFSRPYWHRGLSSAPLSLFLSRAPLPYLRIVQGLISPLTLPYEQSTVTVNILNSFVFLPSPKKWLLDSSCVTSSKGQKTTNTACGKKLRFSCIKSSFTKI